MNLLRNITLFFFFSMLYKYKMQWHLSLYQHSTRLLQVAVRHVSNSNIEKTTCNNLIEDQKAIWYQNGLNRPLLSNTNNLEKRNIFLM